MKTLSLFFIAFPFFKYISFGQDGWFHLVSETVEKFNSIYIIYSNNDLIDCDSGKALHITNIGISFVLEQKSSELSVDYFLKNNFINPFNPTGKIIFPVFQSSNLVIEIFDVLSNEMETLINEAKPTGTDEVSWNTEMLQIVVYFYKFKAGCFVETIQIIFLNKIWGGNFPLNTTIY